MSVALFSAEAIEPEEFFVFPNELEESQSISLTCRADVGSPRGYIQISRVSQNSGKSELIYKFDSISNKTEKCTGFINVTTTYTVTKEDNGAIFRCSSQNNLTQGHEPSKESSKITVICMYRYLNLMHASTLLRFLFLKLKNAINMFCL